MVEHLSGYQNRDYEVVDYKMYELGATGLSFRGPKQDNLTDGRYIVCLGAAQTFGCLCEKPYATILQERTGMPVLNLGYGGAGPYFFLKHASLWPYINNAKLVIIQVMSGRSVNNSLFESGGLEYLTRRSDNQKMSAEAAYDAALKGNATLWEGADIISKARRRVSRLAARLRMYAIVRETRKRWILEYAELLKRIQKPGILLWFSRRRPDYLMNFRSARGLFGDFPQLVNKSMVDAIIPHAPAYVECVSSRGVPQRLMSRFTGKPVSVNLANDRSDFGNCLMAENNYYPTPEMHEDAASAIALNINIK